MAYSEQLGTYRQAGGNSGEIANLYARSTAITAVRAISFNFASTLITSTSFAFTQRSFNRLQRRRDFVPHRAEFGRQQRAFRVDHNVRDHTCIESAQPYRFTQPALHPVPLHRAAKGLPYCKTDTQIARARFAVTPQIKHRHMRSEVPFALLVNPLKVRVP